MNHESTNRNIFMRRILAGAVATLALITCATTSHAFQFAYGELKGSFELGPATIAQPQG